MAESAPTREGSVTSSDQGSWLRRLLLRNQPFVRALEYLTTAGILFFPTGMSHYEVATEGCYALSRLIAFINRLILSRTIERCARLEHYMLVITRAMSHIEVFIEKAAGALTGRRGRAQVIFLIESFKSLCRLGILADRRKPSMLIYWGRETDPDGEPLDMAHYEQWYKAAARCHRGNSSMSMPVSASASTAASLAFSTEFVGKRSGLVLPALPDSALPRATAVQSPPRATCRGVQLNSTPSSSSSSSSSSTSLLSDMLHITGQTVQDRGAASYGASQSTPSTPRSLELEGSPSVDSAPEEGQRERERERERGCDDSPGAASSQTPFASTGSSGPAPNVSGGQGGSAARQTGEAVQAVSSRVLGLTAEQCLVLGELLYVLRPAVYAWAVHQVASRHVVGAGEPGARGATEIRQDDTAEANDQFPHDWDAEAAPSTGAAGGGDSNSNSSSTRNNTEPPSTALRESPQHAFEQAIALAVSLLVEVSSIQLTVIGLRMARERAQGGQSPPLPSSRQHKFDAELTRRRFALMFYLIRSPVFNRATLPLLQLASRMLHRVPLISSLPQYALSMLQYLNSTHFYTSNSS